MYENDDHFEIIWSKGHSLDIERRHDDLLVGQHWLRLLGSLEYYDHGHGAMMFVVLWSWCYDRDHGDGEMVFPYNMLMLIIWRWQQINQYLWSKHVIIKVYENIWSEQMMKSYDENLGR